MKFWLSPVWNIQLDFFPSLNWEKIPVWNTKLAKSKIPVRVVKNVISKWTKMEFPRFRFLWFTEVGVVNPPQCPTMKLNKRSLPKPTTTTGWKLIPHRSKISMNWNPLHWDPIIKYFFKVFFRLTIFFFRNKKSLSKKQLLFSFLCIEKQKKNLERSEIFWKFRFLKIIGYYRVPM